MKKTVILLAGYPATGKSYMGRKIVEKYPELINISPDDVKEVMWDQYGFSSMEEKNELEKQIWKHYYQALDDAMQQGKLLLSDYPFSEKQRPTLEDLTEKHGYQIITIRLTGDIDTLYQRSRSRDLDPSRHLGHLVSCYHKGDTLKDRTKADCLVTYEIFQDRCLNRGYGTFHMGHLIAVDATDFSKIDYDGIVQQITTWVQGDE